MKKILKFIACAIGAVVLLALLLVLTLPLWLGTIFRPAVCAAVPKMTKTTFEMSKLYLNPYTGRFELGGFVLGNPQGYGEPVAASISNLVVDVAMKTLTDKYVHVEEVTVDGVFVSYIDGGEHDVDNFTQIQYNVAGGKEKYEESKKKSEKEKAGEAAEEAVEDEIEELEKKKYVIDRLTVKNVRLKYGILPAISLPVDIVLTDVGKESDGATLSEILDSVWKAMLKGAGAIGDGVKAIGNLFSSGAATAGEGASKAVDAIGEGAKKATETVGEGASKAVDTVGEGASKAVDAVGAGASKATDAVGDGAKKATDAVKNLLSF